MKSLPLLLVLALSSTPSFAQDFNSPDINGLNRTGQNEENRNFNKLSNDTTKEKEIPIGIHAWTVDRRFGDITPTAIDTLPHLYQNTIFNTGLHGEYNTTGNNYTARESRIVIDRPLPAQFMFTQPYSYVTKQPDQIHFTNTLSPFTNISYDNCGNKTNGEDHIDAWFATNAGKRLGLGFNLNYAYARGYYSSQSTSHFGASLFASYIGDKYHMHTVFSTYHQKAAENGGIANDNYITHPESYTDNYAENEIPTLLQNNWNRNNCLHFFLTHRYNIGFYRKVKMTEEEIKARQFAAASKKDNANKHEQEEVTESGRRPGDREKGTAAQPMGRPKGAKIAGDESAIQESLVADTSRIKIDSQGELDSLLAAKAIQDSIDATMKKEYVPVTSFIHTLDINRYDRIYQAYDTPKSYYANTYYNYDKDGSYGGDSIYDQTKLLSVKNTLAIALLEGFNRYAKAGLKVFASHELRRYDMPALAPKGSFDGYVLERWNEHNVSIGGQIVKTQGRTLHYNLLAETWLAGEDAGQIKLDFSTDINFPLFGDTVTLEGKAHFYRLNPTFYQRNYHSKHLWWDDKGLSKETRTRVEGLFTYRKTDTRLRVAIEEIQNYTYFGMSYQVSGDTHTQMSAGTRQCKSNINLLTAQLQQNIRLGILNWENILTYQKSSQEDVLPVPRLNLFTNLFIKFKIVKELAVELGGDAYFFTNYFAPEFCPQLNQFAVQENRGSKTKLGGYPFVDAYANLHLKHTRFFLMFSHANAGNGNKKYFLIPHYPLNGRVLRVGVSWNFFN